MYTIAFIFIGYREGAFAYAIAAAGVAYSIARGCSQGRILSCGCDPSRSFPDSLRNHVDINKRDFLQDINHRWVDSNRLQLNKRLINIIYLV